MIRRIAEPTGVVPWAFVLTLFVTQPLGAGSPVIECDAASKSITVSGIAAETLRNWEKSPPKDWTTVLSVYVGESKSPMLGKHSVGNHRLRFEPRFALEAGLKYRVVLQLDGQKPLTRYVAVEKVHSAPAALVHVYPSGNKLPENQLKFYLHFSAPMRRGDAYEHVALVNEKGEKIDRPFLELGEELWDPSGKRFTLFLHPGRIKRGLKPREELGPPLEEGKKYTLVIDRAWRDAAGNELKSEFRKSIVVGKPDDVQPDHRLWKIAAPKSGSRNQLVVAFNEPMDHALLQRMIWVVDAAGKRVEGIVETANDESEWRFQPTTPWRAGKHRLLIDTELEDLAGNNIARPFEVDEFRKIDKSLQSKTVELVFTID